MKHAVVVLMSALAPVCWAQPADDDVASAREEISALYSEIDSALEEQRFDDVAKMVTPNAVIVAPGGTEMPFSVAHEQMKQILSAGGTTEQTTTITSLTLEGSNAIVRRVSEGTITVGGQTRTGGDTAVDTWVQTPDGWRLVRSAILGAGEIAQPTSPETAEEVATELDEFIRPMDDLAPLGEAVGDARIVALGEATHGTEEIYEAKRRIVEYLATEKGFTVLAVEGNWPEALATDRYIKTGESNPRATLLELGFWTLRTNEVLRLVEWMRDYNADASQKLTFTGVDMQLTEGAILLALEYIRQTVPDQVSTVEAAYQEVRDLGPRTSLSDAGAEAAADEAREIVDLFDRMREAMVAQSSEAEWRDARHAAEVVYQGTANRMEGRSPGYRDEMMARNTMWLMNEAYPGEKIILWAHNSHISRASGLTPELRPMGRWLSEELGQRYYPVGFAVRGGEVLANGPNGFSAYTMPPAPDDSGDGVLSRASPPSFFLDLRSLPEGSVLKRWLDEPHSFYNVGARWFDEMLENNAAVFSMSQSFDGLIFFREGSAAVLME